MILTISADPTPLQKLRVMFIYMMNNLTLHYMDYYENTIINKYFQIFLIKVWILNMEFQIVISYYNSNMISYCDSRLYSRV